MSASASSSARHLIWGPALLIVGNLVDLLLATKVFLHADPLVGALSFFLFGASTGLICQWALARTRMAHRLEAVPPGDTGDECRRQWLLPITAGACGAVGTAAWLYLLGAANPSVAFPLGNLHPVVFGAAEAARGRRRGSTAACSLLLLVVGLWIFRSPSLGSFAGLTTAACVALGIRLFSSLGSETAESFADRGGIVRYNLVRFGALAGIGVPLTVAFLFATARLDACLALIQTAWPLALPLHMLTMVLNFFGGFFRTSARASQKHSLTLCSLAYATPLVLAPLAAVAVNVLFRGLFPTASGSGHLLLGSFLVVASAAWLASGRNPNDR